MTNKMLWLQCSRYQIWTELKQTKIGHVYMTDHRGRKFHPDKVMAISLHQGLHYCITAQDVGLFSGNMIILYFKRWIISLFFTSKQLFCCYHQPIYPQPVNRKEENFFDVWKSDTNWYQFRLLWSIGLKLFDNTHTQREINNHCLINNFFFFKVNKWQFIKITWEVWN